MKEIFEYKKKMEMLKKGGGASGVDGGAQPSPQTRMSGLEAQPHIGEDDEWTVLPRIVCAEHPDHVLFPGYPAHAGTVKTNPEELREVYHSLTHEELEALATYTTLYKYINMEARHRLINLAGTLAKKEAGQKLTRTLAQIFHVSPKHLRDALSEDLKAKDYKEIAVRRWEKEANSTST